MVRRAWKVITNNVGLKLLAGLFAVILWLVVVNIGCLQVRKRTHIHILPRVDAIICALPRPRVLPLNRRLPVKYVHHIIIYTTHLFPFYKKYSPTVYAAAGEFLIVEIIFRQL